MPARLLQVSILVLLGLLGTRSYRSGAPTAFAASACSTQQVQFVGTGYPAAESSIAAIACATSRIRYLAPKTPVRVRFLTADALRAAITQTTQYELAAESASGSATALHLLGALSPLQDLATIYRGQYSIQSAADYDIRSRTRNVRASTTSFTPLDRAVIAHEFTKALQDQSFGLGGRLLSAMSAGNYNSDALLARQAVVEGDAFTTMLDYSASFSRQDQVTFNQQLQDAGTSISDFVHDRIGFPAQQGTAFVKYLMTIAAKGKTGVAASAAAVAAVNHALAHPPVSTRQVLNPSLYLQSAQQNADMPVPTVSLGGQWKGTSTDVLGSFAVADLLGQHQASGSSAQAANQAAVALASDRWALYLQAGDSMLVWRGHFDSTAGASAFVKAFLVYTGGRFHATLATAAPVDWHAAGYAMSLRQRGPEVVLTIGSSPDLQAQCGKASSLLGFG